MKTYSLLALTGPLGAKSFPLRRGLITIGRLEGQSIHLSDETVSRNHALITVSWLGCSITDLQSANGTYVNGERVGRRRLRVGDRIRIGRSEFVLSLAKGDPVFAPPAGPEPLGEELYTRQAIQSISIVGVIGKSPFFHRLRSEGTSRRREGGRQGSKQPSAWRPPIACCASSRKP
ncbi:MAG: FHA domain-containing protein [Candidatus Oleimicrobiaceae bacterium]